MRKELAIAHPKRGATRAEVGEEEGILFPLSPRFLRRNQMNFIYLDHGVM